MDFIEAPNGVMAVTDGRQCVATAKRTGSGYWMLHLYRGSWTDPRARRPLDRPDGYPAGFKAMWPRYPEYIAVKSKREARKILLQLSQTGVVKN